MRTFLAAALLAVMTLPAFAQQGGPQCIPVNVLDEMATKHGAKVAATGVVPVNNQRVRMVLLVKEGGAWGLFFIGPDGLACLGGSGIEFSTVAPPVGRPANWQN